MLYEVFNAVGPVASIRVCRDSVTRKSLGYAYVNYHNVADAERALDTLNYSQIKGRSCRIMWSHRDPAMRKAGQGNIFVKNLDANIDNKALYDTFSLFGNILSCKVACETDGKSKGYGFVHFEAEDSAKQAIERVNGMQIGENTVTVERYTKPSERDAEPKDFTNLYVKNMPKSWDDAKLKEMFAEFGTVTSTLLQKDAKGRSFAFVNFETYEMAKAAIEGLEGKDFRTDEDKAAGKEDEEKKEEEPKDYGLFVGRAMSKQERARKLAEQFGTPINKGKGKGKGKGVGREGV